MRRIPVKGGLHKTGGPVFPYSTPEFVEALASLELKLKSAEEIEQSKLDEVDVAKNKLSVAHTTVDQAQQKRMESSQQVESIEQQIQSLKNNLP